jgi:hypothetical protein
MQVRKFERTGSSLMSRTPAQTATPVVSRAFVISAMIGWLVVLGPATASAQEQAPRYESGAEDKQRTEDATIDGDEDSKGYPLPGRIVGGPTDVDFDLATSFPQPGALFSGGLPARYFGWKEDLYDDVGLKLAFSYQTLYQTASDTATGNDSAWGGWLLLEAKWEALNRGEDNEGSLTFDVDWRHTIGNNAAPAAFGTVDVGSLWPTDVPFFEWDPSLAIIYWEQWFQKDVFNLRAGKQLAANTFDFFRFKDGRTSFTASPFTAHTSIPAPAFGQAISFKWWPHKDSSLYVHGTLNDMNGDPQELGLDTFFNERQYFYGLEVGYFWRPSLRDFDHVHLDLFFADEKDSQLPILPNEAGGGAKLLGSKQWGSLVGFGSYTYNTAEGGGLGLTFGEHTVTAGVATLSPFGIKGEIGLGSAWMDPVNSGLGDQYGAELYWKLLLTPDLWITPGVQVVVNPAFNPAQDSIAIAQLKLRLFL